MDGVGVGVGWEGVDDVCEGSGVVHRGDCSCREVNIGEINKQRHEFSLPD